MPKFLSTLWDWLDTPGLPDHGASNITSATDDLHHRSMFEDDTGMSSFGGGLNHDDHTINPASGLPMINGIAGVDVAGNPYGTDLNDHFHHPISDSFRDHSWD